MNRYNWMRSYLARVMKQKGNKFFVCDGVADEIKEMMDEMESRIAETYKLLAR